MENICKELPTTAPKCVAGLERERPSSKVFETLLDLPSLCHFLIVSDKYIICHLSITDHEEHISLLVSQSNWMLA